MRAGAIRPAFPGTMTQKYLKHPKDGSVYAWTEALSKLSGWKEVAVGADAPAALTKPNTASDVGEARAALMLADTRDDLEKVATDYGLDMQTSGRGRNFVSARKHLLDQLN